MANISSFKPLSTLPAGSRVMVAMSGGVDSAVAALLLQRAGYDVSGATFVLFDDDESEVNAKNIQDARQVAQHLGIDHVVLNFASQFECEVIERFCNGYERGETPNPCIDCNRFIKFGAFAQQCRQLGYDAIATGHYARCLFDEIAKQYVLACAADITKDQSYVLYRLVQDDLAHLVLPLGEFSKDEVRKIADEAGLPVAHKQESQDICFVPDGDYAGFIKRQGREFQPGRIVDTDGNVVGEHNGLACYTIGQRKGIGIAAREPLYVLDKDPLENILIVGPKHMLKTRDVYARDITFIAENPPEALESSNGFMRVSAKTSYRQTPYPASAWLTKASSNRESCELHVLFDEPIVKPACGQSLVIYDDALVVGGGIIVSDEARS